jgi:two-component system response regulator HydG
MAMQSGASDFTIKDLIPKVLIARITKAIEQSNLEKGLQALQGSLSASHDRIVFASPQMRKVLFETTRIANLDFDVLIEGETGVGKDLIAHEIHRRSRRRSKPFIPIPMKALSETLMESELFGHERGAFSGAEKAKIGKLEAAEGGTVYLPEVSSLNEEVQLKMLHFMQYKTVSKVGQDPRRKEKRLDVRIIMATNDPLEQLVDKGAMRLDFSHRIAGVKLRIPPLRERPEDIEPLANYFLEKNSSPVKHGKLTFAPEVITAFKAHEWKGNIRELENWIKNALVYVDGTVLSLEQFPHFVEYKPNPDPNQCQICISTRFHVIPSYREADRGFKQAYLKEILRRAEGRIPQAASMAGLTPQGLRKLLRSLDLGKS